LEPQSGPTFCKADPTEINCLRRKEWTTNISSQPVEKNNDKKYIIFFKIKKTKQEKFENKIKYWGCLL
jgi:hypothetical protein